MKKFLSFITCGFLILGNSIVYGQNKKDQFDIVAKSVEGEIYPIEVVLPDGYDPSLRYPVAYMTDWWFSAQTGPQLYNRLRFVDAIEPIIIVGIGTHGDMTDWRLERIRDLTPTNVPAYDVPELPETGSKGVSGSAANFLSFIKKELIPLIDAKYSTDTLNRGLIGYSLGGLFGVYVLTSEPQLFQNYLIGSPTLRYDDFVMIDRLKEIPSDKLLSVRSIFVSVGEEESGDYLKGFADFRDIIGKKDLPNLKIKSHIVLGEGHMLASTPAVTKGLKFLYGTK